jgi:hypothetical protein
VGKVEGVKLPSEAGRGRSWQPIASTRPAMANSKIEKLFRANITILGDYNPSRFGLRAFWALVGLRRYI